MMLAQNLATLLDRPVDDRDRARAALLLLDWTGCAVAGYHMLTGTCGLADITKPSGASVCIGGASTDTLTAAFHNGLLGNVLEMDDVDRQAILHPGPTVIPAAIARSGTASSAGQTVLDAIVQGYEATIRIGRAAGAGHYALWHSTATAGAFGAAAAASVTHRQTRAHALTLAGSMAAGLWQTRHDPDSHGKQIHTAHAAQVGVQAAQLASAGMKGPKEFLEGPQGFFDAMCPGANPQDVMRDYGGHWLIHDTSIKPYPACRHAHAAIDATLIAARAEALPEGDIVIETYDDALKFCDKPNPKTEIEAKFSLQHCVAHTLLFGAPKLTDFDAQAVNTTEVLRRRISVRAAPRFNTAYPAHYGAAVVINGQTFTAHDALGDPENPLSETAVIAKAKTLMRYAGIDDQRAEDMCQAALNIGAPDGLQQYLDPLT